METTKTGLRQRIHLPKDMITVLRWHIETQLVTHEQRASELLFPREDGLPRSESSLKKAFAEVSRALALLSASRRAACGGRSTTAVETIVTRSISGHLTDRMHAHYSTVSANEQRDGLHRVMGLILDDAVLRGTPTGTPPLEVGLQPCG